MRAFVAAFLTACAVSDVAAQQRATLQGRVVDPDGRGVSAAVVRVLGTGAATLSDSAGRYLLRGVPAGRHSVQVSHLSYGGYQVLRTFGAGASLVLDVTLRIEPLAGDTLLAEATKVGPRLASQLREFEQRRSRGDGYFFTHGDIERMQAQSFTDVLRRVPGMVMQPVDGPYGASYVPQLQRSMGMAGGRPCPIVFFINGSPVPVSADFGIDNLIRASDVIGVEVYGGAARLPAQFSATSSNSRCGVVVIWAGAHEPDR